MTKKRSAGTTVSALCDAMETIAPTQLAQEWDNVGLLAGDPAAPLKKVLLCIDLTDAVVTEAIADRADAIMAYHPPIFRPIKSIRADSGQPDAAVFRCVANGIAVYSTHTALDAADGGTNDVIAGLCGIKHTVPLEHVPDPTFAQSKIVVFVPEAEVERVAHAMFEAGAGHIGDYSSCSYRVGGQGTFLGGATTNPTIGTRGKLEFVVEQRVEMVVASRAVPAVVKALTDAHSYEEPAYDIYPLTAPPKRGIGRMGDLPRPLGLKALARSLQKKTSAACVQIVGDPDQELRRAVIVVGAAGSLPFKVGVGPGDVVITGEIRHHDALTIRRRGSSAIALGHWASERPTLPVLAERLTLGLPGVKSIVAEHDIDPFGVA